MTEWRLLPYQVKNGFNNMAVDEAILQIHSQGKTPPTLRFYGWKPPALSLGYFQSLEEKVDRESCRTRGIDVVRRLTGGRAILHDQELTYSLTVREELNLLDSSIVKSYKEISQGLVKGLKKLDIPVSLTPRQKGQKAPRGDSAACFDTPSWYEVVIGGKKLIGSAQTRKWETILQHGSLPLTLDADLIFNLFKIDNERRRKRLKRFFLKHSTGLYQHTEKKYSPKTLEKYLVQGLSDHFAIEIQPGSLTEEEQQLAAELSRKKYSQKSWNARK